MEKTARDFLKAERQRLRLNQTALAQKAGITQGMVSKLEIDPDYEPTVVVLARAVRGLGLTLSEFFRQIESGLPAEELSTQDPPSRKAAHDESAQTPTEAIQQTVIDTLADLLVKARTQADETNLRQGGDSRTPKPSPSRRRRERDRRPNGSPSKRRLK